MRISEQSILTQLESVKHQIESASFRDTFSRVRFEAMEKMLQKEACLVMAVDSLNDDDMPSAIEWFALSQEA